jgi:hypothetical protein
MAHCLSGYKTLLARPNGRPDMHYYHAGTKIAGGGIDQPHAEHVYKEQLTKSLDQSLAEIKEPSTRVFVQDIQHSSDGVQGLMIANQPVRRVGCILCTNDYRMIVRTINQRIRHHINQSLIGSTISHTNRTRARAASSSSSSSTATEDARNHNIIEWADIEEMNTCGYGAKLAQFFLKVNHMHDHILSHYVMFFVDIDWYYMD